MSREKAPPFNGDWCDAEDAAREIEKFIDYQAAQISQLKRLLKDTELLCHAYYVLATEAGIKPGSRELIEAAGRFQANVQPEL